MSSKETKHHILTRDYPFSNSYPTPASGGGGARRANNPYAQQDDRTYEMSDVRDSTTQLSPNGDSMSAFYAEVNLVDSPCVVTQGVTKLLPRVDFIPTR